MMLKNFIKTPYQYLMSLWKDITSVDLFLHAGALAFYTLLTIIPSLTLVLYVTSISSPYLSDSDQIATAIQDFVLNNFEKSSGEEIGQILTRTLKSIDINKIGVIGLLGAVYSNLLLVRQIELALNKIWQVEVNRKIYRRAVGFLLFGLVGGLALILSYTFTKDWYIAFQNMGPNVYAGIFKRSLVWIFTLAIIYRLVPNYKVPYKHAFFAGLKFGLLLQILVHYYSYYVLILTNYQNIYGALASFPIFLIWLQCVWLLILVGALSSRRLVIGKVV